MAAHFLQRSRHGTISLFRRRIPLDLAPFLRRRQIYRSLGTSDARAALAQARVLAVESDILFDALRDMAKKRGGLRQDWEFTLDFDPSGKPRITAKTDPHDSEQERANVLLAVRALTQQVLAPELAAPGAASNATATKVGKTLRKAVDEFLKSPSIVGALPAL